MGTDEGRRNQSKEKHMKRITIPVDDNIDAIKRQLEEDFGVSFTYVQVIGFLIKQYRKSKPPKTEWRQ